LINGQAIITPAPDRSGAGRNMDEVPPGGVAALSV
jgi:hypothetical protein